MNPMLVGWVALALSTPAPVLFAGAAAGAEAPAASAASPDPARVALPETAHVVAVGRPARLPGSDAIDPAFMGAVVAWLARSHGLPAAPSPAVMFAPAEMMVALRFRDVDAASVRSGPASQPPEPSTIVAVYDDEAQAIYLPDGWTGATAVEQSVLVHEMVHHLQNLAGLTYPCPQAREKLAYAAQAAWLALFGGDLFADFDMDGLTLLVRTECGF